MKADRFSLMLLFFVVTLLALFFYLVGIDKSIRHYDVYRQKLQKMALLNHQIETVFYQKYRYVDLDHVSVVTSGFEQCLTTLEHSSLKEEFGRKIYLDLQRLARDYQEKEYLLQKFEALNARMINSIHTIFDLRKSIEGEIPAEDERRKEIQQLFFTIFQVMIDMPTDRKQLGLLRSKLNDYAKE